MLAMEIVYVSGARRMHMTEKGVGQVEVYLRWNGHGFYSEKTRSWHIWATIR